MTTLTFSEMSKSYGGTPALADASLSLTGGRVHALMGENGAGKSTLIKLLAGVIPADRLEASVDGTAIALPARATRKRRAFALSIKS